MLEFHTQGDAPPSPWHKPGYQLEFHDDFTGSVLDPGRWLPHYLPQWSTPERSRARYRLTGHSLQLLIEQDQLPWNPPFDGELRVSSLQTGCHSGPAGSAVGQHRFKPGLKVITPQPPLQLYTPQHGYFEVRMKVPALAGYMGALWMIGLEDQPERSGEICICELFGKGITGGTSELGYGVHPFGDPNLTDEFYLDTFPIRASDFHVYGVDWTEDRLDFYLDGVKIRTIHQSPSYPMQFMLNIYEIPQQLTPETAAAPWPRAMEVSEVRGYRRI